VPGLISKKAFAVLVLLLLLMPKAALAQKNFTFGEVEIQGNHRVGLSTIRSVISVKAGESVSMKDIDRDVRAVYKLGKFKDVSAEVEQQNGTKVLIYHVKERPLVREVSFSGYKEFKKKKLEGLVKVKTPDFYHPREVSASVEAIEKAYAAEGYYAAKVTPKVKVDAHNEATIVFDIREGNQVYVQNIRFAGNKAFSDGELKKVMETKEKWFLSWLTGRGKYNKDMLESDQGAIADHYFNDGYVQVKVEQPVVTLSKDKKSMDILIRIEEGPQFRVGDIGVQGDLVESKKKLLSLIPLKKGDIFSRQKLRTGVLAINDLYADRGFAYVNVSPLTHLNPQKRTIALNLEIEKGIKVRIDRIHISGNTKTRDKVIRREMKLAEGDLYSASKLKESNHKIKNLGFFDEVNVSTAKGPDAAHMDVDVTVKEKPTGTFSLGFGYSSVDGPIAQGSVSQKNFLGRGLQLNLAGAVGGKSTTYQAGILDPYFLDMNLALGFDVYKTKRDWNDYTQKSTGGDLKAGFPLTDNTRAFFIYRFEKKEILNVDPNASLVIQDQAGKSTLSSITGTLTRDTTDYRLDPTKGSVASLSMTFAGIGGTEKFARYQVDDRYFFPWKWGTVFSVRGHLGYMQTVGGKEIPIDERFFLGGLDSLRGFRVREAGPRIRTTHTVIDPATGEVKSSSSSYDYIGGNKEAYFNLEYTFPLVKDVGVKGVAFFDTGNAWGSGEDYFSDMRYDAGLGIRWFSPMGPLRLEWGYNLSPRDGEPHSVVQFSIGQFF
jgi:outer membrane protein insertion porin family